MYCAFEDKFSVPKRLAAADSAPGFPDIMSRTSFVALGVVVWVSSFPSTANGSGPESSDPNSEAADSMLFMVGLLGDDEQETDCNSG